MEKYCLLLLQEEMLNQGCDTDYINKCLTYAKKLRNNDLPVIFDLEHFSIHVGYTKSYISSILYDSSKFYHEFNINKKSGKPRNIKSPALELKKIQKWILNKILYNINISEFATGFCKEKSVVHNANIHLNKKCLLNLDLKDFFPSIKFNKVYSVFRYYGYTNDVAHILAKVCTFEGCLPQGSPASPMISNIICIKLDKRLSKLAESFGANYSRYADDITFSGDDLRFILPVVKKIIIEEGFDINENKTRVFFQHQKQIVTGLVVNNNKVRLDKFYKRKVEQEIYYCTKYGVSNHLKHIGCSKRYYKDHLYGKVYYIYMIEEELGRKLLNMLDVIGWDY